MERVDLGVCEGRLHAADPRRVVVVLPGAHYPPSAPLLLFAREAARGAGVRDVLAREHVQKAGSREQAQRLARSWGVAGKGGEPEGRRTVRAVRPRPEGDASCRQRRQPRPQAGFAGREGGAIRDALELDGADHALQVPGDLGASVRLLGEVAAAVERFLAES